MWMDNAHRYGLVSRFLHWSMACLLLWQLFTILMWGIFGETRFVIRVTSFGPYHRTVGLFTLLLVVLRAIWAAINHNQRPPKAAGLAGILAACMHRLLYALMFVIPALAVLRDYGSGRGLALWGFRIVPATGRQAEWMIALADALHSELSWLLYSCIAGHVIAALGHRFFGDRKLAGRMLTPLRSIDREQKGHVANFSG